MRLAKSQARSRDHLQPITIAKRDHAHSTSLPAYPPAAAPPFFARSSDHSAKTGLDRLVSELLRDRGGPQGGEPQAEAGTRLAPPSEGDHPLFSASWYWEQCQKGTAHEDMRPHDHYVQFGWVERRWPHPLFDPDFYEQACAERGIACEGNPIDHYNAMGAHLRIAPHRLFDPEWYAQELARVGRRREDSSLTDYLVHGDPAGLSPHALFSNPLYRATMRVDDLPCLVHYVLGGWASRVSPHPLFEAGWYLDRYELAASAFDKGIDPVTHYLLEGDRCGFTPHPALDRAWYCDLHLRDADWKRTVLEHAIYKADRSGVRLSPSQVYDLDRAKLLTQHRVCVDGDRPLVSVIIVNMDGGRHLDELFASLAAQTYENFEIVFVDNASRDGSVAKVRTLCPHATIVPLARNAGFAEANNIGLVAARGELIALLNNDTKVDANWLGELVLALRRWPGAGAVTSRVRFWSKFLRLRIEAPAAFSLDYAALLASLSYKKCFTNAGTVAGDWIRAVESGSGYAIELKVPAGERSVALRVPESAKLSICAGLGERMRERLRFDDRGTAALDLTGASAHGSSFVLNNAGSYEPSWLTTRDIGFGEFDMGQHGREREVDLACGCAMIVRRAALLGDALFASDYIAYFEDSELSRRLRRSGFSVVYAPGAIVYHKHSSTSLERSAFWHKQVRRNGILYKYMEMPKALRPAYLRDELLSLNHYSNWLTENAKTCTVDESTLREVLPSVIDEIKALCRKVDAGTILDRAAKTRIGLYNRYWNTLGGGEAHALFVASYLAKFEQVELISDIDFDVDTLRSYFNVDVGMFRKRLVERMSTELTEEYDVFINSTYMDETPSGAAHSFYIVSFPSRSPSPEFLKSYTFLANSNYTRTWIARYWGDHDPSVALLEPVVSDAFATLPISSEKRKVILSVGRFFTAGHSKNQLQIVRAFKAARLSGWVLKLAGSVGDHAYFSQVEAEAAGCSVELHPNASFQQLQQLYRESAVYVHAAGLGRSAEEEPENFEHFGMTVAEACSAGCYPIVYHCAGPAEIVDRLGCGATFSGEAELVESMRYAESLLAYDKDIAAKLREKARVFSAAARSETMRDVLAEIVEG